MNMQLGIIVKSNAHDQNDDTKSRISVSGTIKCSQCSKMMQSDAKVCGFCSYDLVTKQPAKRSKTPLMGCFAVIALLILGVAILGGIRSIVSEGPPAQTLPVQ